MSSRDFDAWLHEQSAESVDDFRLGERTFHVRNPVPATPGLRLSARMQAGESTTAMWRDYLVGLVIEDAADVDAAMEASGIHADGLREICLWIAQGATGRPTAPSRPSPRRSSTTGRSGKSGSRRSASTPRPSLSVAS